MWAGKQDNLIWLLKRAFNLGNIFAGTGSTCHCINLLLWWIPVILDVGLSKIYCSMYAINLVLGPIFLSYRPGCHSNHFPVGTLEISRTVAVVIFFICTSICQYMAFGISTSPSSVGTSVTPILAAIAIYLLLKHVPFQDPWLH